MLVLAYGSPAFAGYYGSFDLRAQEMRWSRDYEGTFSGILDDLKSIAIPSPLRDPVIRRRYVLMDAMAGDGSGLRALDQKLNYTNVLIRRNKPDEAVQYLLRMVDEFPDHFLVLSHCASAHFLGSREFHPKAAFYMKKALKQWPKTWDDLKEHDQRFLENFGWDRKDFEDYRLYETYFERLILHRNDEEKKLARKEAVPVVVDPIFVDVNGKPLRFGNEQGEFEPGQLAQAEKDKLPRNAVEVVEQLLMWKPHDDRLLWLLGEAFNASAVQETVQKTKNELIRSAAAIFKSLDTKSFKQGLDFPGKAEIARRHEKLAEFVGKMSGPDLPDLKLPDDQPKNDFTRDQFWRAIGVSFITGLAVGIFALWQWQEVRRRKQAKAAAT
jgi:tetratricopeptide (TPR) repeat protein